MSMKTILWPTDLSTNSLEAAPQVINLAEQLGAHVELMYVGVDLCSHFPAYGNYPSQEVVREFQGWEAEQAKKKLARICEEDLTGCPSTSVRVVTGDPVEEIIGRAREIDGGMIVMTTLGAGNQGGNAPEGSMGHVAQRVLSNSPVPVTTVARKNR